MAYITLENISKIIIEDILIKGSKNNKIEVLVTSNNKPNNLISGIDNTNKGFLINFINQILRKLKRIRLAYLRNIRY